MVSLYHLLKTLGYKAENGFSLNKHEFRLYTWRSPTYFNPLKKTVLQALEVQNSSREVTFPCSIFLMYLPFY